MNTVCGGDQLACWTNRSKKSRDLLQASKGEENLFDLNMQSLCQDQMAQKEALTSYEVLSVQIFSCEVNNIQMVIEAKKAKGFRTPRNFHATKEQMSRTFIETITQNAGCLNTGNFVM